MKTSSRGKACFARFALAASIAFALAFTFSCTDNGGKDNLPPVSEAGDKPENFAGLTNDGHDLLVFQQGDLDEILFKIDTVYITDTTFLGRLHFRNLPDSKTPAPGDIINSAIAKKAPYGFLYRVAEVAKEEGEVTIVSVSYASLAEAVENLELEFLVPLVYEDEDEADSGAKMQVNAKWWKKFTKWVSNTVVAIVEPIVKFVEDVIDVFAGNWDVGGRNNLTIEVIDKKASIGDKNSKYSGEVKLNGKYVLALNVRLVLNNYNLDYAKMSVAQSKELKLEGLLKGSLNYKYEHILAQYELPDVSFWAGPVFIYLANTGIVKAKVEAEAEAKISAELAFKEYSEFGFEYVHGSWNKIDICDKDFGFDYKHSIYGTARLGVLVGFRSLFFGVGGLEVSAGPSLILKTPNLTDLSANSNLSLDVDLDVDMKVHFQFLNWLNKSYDFGKWQTYLGNLSRSKILSTFDSLVASELGVSYTEIKSAIERPSLGFQVENHGICLGKSENECTNGGGIRQSFGAISDNKKHEIKAGFSDLPAGTYYARTFFESGIEGDIHYDKATVFVIGPTSSSSSEETPSSSSLTEPSSSSETAGFIDSRDGQFYGTTVIGTQTWMAQNLNYDAEGSECYDDDPANCEIYGRHYNWETAMIACPIDWHLPSSEEWSKLIDHVGAEEAHWKLRATDGWALAVYDGTDDYGFSALPGGTGGVPPRYGFERIGAYGQWWSSTEGDWGITTFTINSNYSYSGFNDAGDKRSRNSVRCLKD